MEVFSDTATKNKGNVQPKDILILLEHYSFVYNFRHSPVEYNVVLYNSMYMCYAVECSD